MKVIHVNFKKNRALNEMEISDKLADESGEMQDPIIRWARSLAHYNQSLEEEVNNEGR